VNGTVAIATITLARTEAEAGKLRASLTVLSALGLPVFVADGGSPDPFLTDICKLPHVTIHHGAKGLVAQVKQGIDAAATSGADVVVYTEPDKQEFFTHGIGGLIDRAAGNAGAPIVLATRHPEAMATFPRGQRQIEQSFSGIAAELLGFHADLLYGPLALRRPFAAKMMPGVPDDLGWGWRPYLMARAIKAGETVLPHEGHFECPADQRGEDDEASRLYRLKQLIDNVRGLHSGLSS
jgi:hypothetical protein